MKIDLHVHTRDRSFCARSPEEEQIRAAIDHGLDALALTDHDTLASREHLAYLNAKYAPLRIFGGIEVSLGLEHVLVLGIHDLALERRSWSYADLQTFVREREGFLALAHPFRFNGHINVNLERFPPHALEVCSHNTPRRAESHIRQLAERLDIALLTNSDAHHADEIGAHYNVLEHAPENEKELIAMLKTGAFNCVAPS